MTPPHKRSIWVYAALYFACYVPYVSLTKLLGEGLLAPGIDPVGGATVLPLATAMSVLVTLVFLALSGWWRLVPTRGGLPFPSAAKALSGLCTAAILSATTIAYALEGVSIVLMMLMMRGGVLVLAPMVDRFTGRHTRKASWLALGMSLLALGLASRAPEGGITSEALLVLTVYLGSYFLRFQIMSRLAKSPDIDANRRYFAEEQLIAAPATLLILGGMALLGSGDLAQEVRQGFTQVPWSAAAPAVLAVGAFSQGVGIFGTLVFLDPRENTYAVLVNRSTSILAGVTASLFLASAYGVNSPSPQELGGAALVLLAMGVLASQP